MPRLNLPPTKSNLLALRRQLAFAEEGRDLLEQKRQILIYELTRRMRRAGECETRLVTAMAAAHVALRDATLAAGVQALDAAALGIRSRHAVELSQQRLMGMWLPAVEAKSAPAPAAYGVGGTCAQMDLAAQSFSRLMALVVELTELQNAVRLLAAELRKTQRRCNALSKLFIPDYRETISYIAAALEERERESFIILKMIRDRMDRATGQGIEAPPGQRAEK